MRGASGVLIHKVYHAWRLGRHRRCLLLLTRLAAEADGGDYRPADTVEGRSGADRTRDTCPGRLRGGHCARDGEMSTLAGRGRAGRGGIVTGAATGALAGGGGFYFHVLMMSRYSGWSTRVCIRSSRKSCIVIPSIRRDPKRRSRIERSVLTLTITRSCTDISPR